MIERLIELSIRHRAIVIVASVLLAISGVIAIARTPMDAVPDLSENQVIVFADWPGHNPREIDEQVTYPLSLRLQGIDGVRVVRGSSDQGYSMLHLIFDDAVSFPDARTRVQERLALPGDVLPDGVVARLAPDAVPTGQIFWYTVEGSNTDLGRLRDVQDWYLRPQLSSVSGVAEVASVGGFVREYTVEIDPAKLQTLGLSPREVCDAVTHAQQAVGGNVIHKGDAEYLVHTVSGLGASRQGSAESAEQQTLQDLGKVLIPTLSRASREPSSQAEARQAIALKDVARLTIGPKSRRGVFEKDGNEVVGGVIMMRYGHNPLEVTRAIRRKLTELQAGLPDGVQVRACYDRTPLIEGAVSTVTGTVIEAMISASICVLIVLRHLRTSFIIVITLPLAALASFTLMAVLRWSGIVDIQTSIMSLAGIAISIGILVDSSIVMAENAMQQLRRQFGDEPVRGDVRETVIAACQMVGRPIFFSVLIMLISFLPVFALGGIDGRLFRPLAFTKTFALIAVAILSVTLVPALCTIFIRGRLRAETDSWLLRSVMEMYRPVLNSLLNHPAAMAWIISVTFLLGMAPVGHDVLFRGVLFVGLLSTAWIAAHGATEPIRLRSLWRHPSGVAIISLMLVGLTAQQMMRPLGTDLRMPLDEGMVMDMPITVPRISVTQAGNDLKARNMLLCRFPEVKMVVGKAGRAETPFDPAPLDMIETMVEFRPAEHWPRRKIRLNDAAQHTRSILESLISAKLVTPPKDSEQRTLLDESALAAHSRCELALREVAYARNQEFQTALARELQLSAIKHVSSRWYSLGRLKRELTTGDIVRLQSSLAPHLSHHFAMMLEQDDLRELAMHMQHHLAEFDLLGDDVTTKQVSAISSSWMQSINRLLDRESPSEIDTLQAALRSEQRSAWAQYTATLNGDLQKRAAVLMSRLAAEELLSRAEPLDNRIDTWLDQIASAKQSPVAPKKIPESDTAITSESTTGEHHHGLKQLPPLPVIEPIPQLDELLETHAIHFRQRILLWACERSELSDFGGEIDQALQMPGWTNIWTRPIQNRVDMLMTGVNTEIGVRVLGHNLDDVVSASEEVAEVLRGVSGAADVIADPVRGKGYLEIVPNRERAAEAGVELPDLWSVIATALGGQQVGSVLSGRERHDVRVRCVRDASRDEEAVKQLPVRCRSKATYVPLSHVADVRITEGPASIKSENGLLRNYVRLNVRNRGIFEFLSDARRAVADQVQLPEGTFLEWTGQFEYAERTFQTLKLVTPVVIGLILLILWLTYRDWADTCLMLLAVPGAIAGGVLFQWLFGFRWSVPVAVGYLACFGMATSTGIIMLVYLREAVEKRGPFELLTEVELRAAVLEGAVHRLRPKLLTEGTTILGLAPMLWASDVGAEVIRPMAAPVLGGILVADEVIDLFLPVLFYHVRLWRLKRLRRQLNTQAPPSTKPALS